MAERLSTELSAQNGIAIMAVRGRIDLDTADDFRSHVLSVIESGKPKSGFLILELSQLEYISSVGLRALMLAAKASKKQGGMLAIASYVADVREVFQIARIELIVKLFENLDDAVNAVVALANQAEGGET